MPSNVNGNILYHPHLLPLPPTNITQRSGPGENIAYGQKSPEEVCTQWGVDEIPLYDGAFSAAAGHFTQMVWRATTSMGCARVNCLPLGGVDGVTVPLAFVVCQYMPGGNVEGRFVENVVM